METYGVPNIFLNAQNTRIKESHIWDGDLLSSLAEEAGNFLYIPSKHNYPDIDAILLNVNVVTLDKKTGLRTYTVYPIQTTINIKDHGESEVFIRKKRAALEKLVLTGHDINWEFWWVGTQKEVEKLVPHPETKWGITYMLRMISFRGIHPIVQESWEAGKAAAQTTA